MAALKNLRHEKFVRGLVTGLSQRKAYLQAGYDCKPTTADVGASMLIRNPKVEARVNEILRPAAAKAQVTLASLVAEADEAMAAAKADRNHASVINALTLKAKMTGHLRDKVEVGGPGAFDAMQTPDEVLAKVRQELGETAFLMLQASTVEEPEPAPKPIENMGR